MKKKILCLLIAVVMIFGCISMLASCGGDDGDNDGDTTADGGNDQGGNDQGGNDQGGNNQGGNDQGGNDQGGSSGDHTECYDEDDDGYCDYCDEPIGDAPCMHDDVDGDEFCDYCAEFLGTKVEMKPKWTSATIVMQLNLSDNKQELSSELVRYVQGASTYSSNVDKAVRVRNIAASNETKVNVNYKYWDNVEENVWGKTIEHIEQMINSTTLAEKPDVYSTFIYDLVGASVKGYFANLKGTSRGTGELGGLNYFEFVYDERAYEAAYQKTGEDRGFMYEWMESVTLDPNNRMYVLASDYYIDMVRAFFMIPVNVSMIEDYVEDITGDRNEDGEFTIDDFYAQVKAGEWTYDLMMEYSALAYTPDTDGQTGKWLGDNQLGFAMADGGVACSGIIYTSSVEVINKKWDTAANDWVYSYSQSNPDLETLVSRIDTLLSSEGVVLVKEAKQFGESHLIAIRNRFADGAVLFGDIMMVGALEFSQYQDMGENAFGVVPVPIYREDNFDENGNQIDRYLTQIHNVGRPGAIAKNTNKFVECTAFLNYQSTNSSEILNNYYTYNLCYGAAGGSAGTVEMLEYLRENVRTSFDMVMEDAQEVFYGSDYDALKVTNLINADNDFYCPSFYNDWSNIYEDKVESLATLVAWFRNAAD